MFLKRSLLTVIADTMWTQFLLEVLPAMGCSGKEIMCQMSSRDTCEDGKQPSH
jgi:hypothetical protein